VNTQYKLAATTSATVAAFDTVSANHGDIITLIGQGGTTATTLAQNIVGTKLVVLKSGTTWTALDGSVIHLQIFKAGAVTIFTELSRA
jgi:ABC-type branched-subunit amino acid transport system ATPase component